MEGPSTLGALKHVTLAGTHFSGSEPSVPPLSEVRSRQALLATGLRCVFARLAASTALPLRWMWLQAVDFHGSHQARIPVKR